MERILYSRMEGKGVPFIIMHGYLGMSDNWKSFGTQLASLGYEVHLLDLRNHGRSFHDSVFTYDAMVEDVHNYMTEQKLEHAIVLGHSMGGKVAMKFATTYPDKVLKLLVADIAPKAYAPHHQDILAGLNAVDFSKKPSRNEVDEILSAYVKDVSTRMFLMKSLYWIEPGQLAFRFNLAVFNQDENVIGEGLSENAFYEGATLFLKGARSNYILDSDAEMIKRIFPNSKIVSIADAGHWLHAENPEDFYQAVKIFLEQ